MNGDRYETVAKKVAERLDVSYGKATNIVRTETHRVTESGFMDCAKDIADSLDGAGLVYTATWRTMKDERVRPQNRYYTKSGWKTTISRNGANHQKMEGVTIKVGDKFQLEPNVYAECPSASGTARNDCRCRCFLEYDLLTAEEFEKLTGKSVDNSGGSGIIKAEDSRTAVKDVHFIGKIDVEKYKCVTEDIQTDEVIITDRQIEHIKERHPKDYEMYFSYAKEIIQNPDYILEANKPNTAFVLKRIIDNEKNYQLILRLKTSQDPKEYKNSVITFLKVDDRKWAKYLRNKKILYNKNELVDKQE